MLISNDVVRDTIDRVLARSNGSVSRDDIDYIIRDILANVGVNIGGKTAKREGYIAGINRSLMLLVREADGSKVLPLKPGMSLEIMTDDYDHPYLQAKVVAAPDGPYMQRIEGAEIDAATTPVIGSYARTVVQLGVTDPPDKQLSTDSQAARLAGPDEPASGYEK